MFLVFDPSRLIIMRIASRSPWLQTWQSSSCPESYHWLETWQSSSCPESYHWLETWQSCSCPESYRWLQTWQSSSCPESYHWLETWQSSSCPESYHWLETWQSSSCPESYHWLQTWQSCSCPESYHWLQTWHSCPESYHWLQTWQSSSCPESYHWLQTWQSSSCPAGRLVLEWESQQDPPCTSPLPSSRTYHFGRKMYLRVCQTQSYLFLGQPLGSTWVVALFARVPPCVYPVADWAQLPMGAVGYCRDTAYDCGLRPCCRGGTLAWRRTQRKKKSKTVLADNSILTPGRPALTLEADTLGTRASRRSRNTGNSNNSSSSSGGGGSSSSSSCCSSSGSSRSRSSSRQQ